MATLKRRDIPEAAYTLGNLRGDFRISTIQLVLCVLMLVFLVGFIGWMGIGAFPGALAPQNATDVVMLIGIVAAILGAGGWGGWEIRKLVRNRSSCVLLFDDGFVSIRQQRVFVCRWDDVASVFDGTIFANDAYVRCCTVYKRSDEEWTVRNDTDLIQGFPQLVAAVIEETKRRLVPQMLAALEAGQSIDFGCLTLTPEGIVYNDRLLPWSELKAIRCEELGVSIDQRGAWVTWAAINNGAVPNRYALQKVAQVLKKALAMTLLA